MGMDLHLARETLCLAADKFTILEALQDKLGKTNVLYTKGADLEIENELEIQKRSN
jgi:beta-glucosidase